jgi:hypothetical protein
MLDLDPVVVNWSHGSAIDAVKRMYVNFEDALPDSLKKKLKKYTDHIMMNMEDDWNNGMNTVLVRVEEVLKEFDKDAIDVMREAVKKEHWDVGKPAKKRKMTVEEEEEDDLTIDH